MVLLFLILAVIGLVLDGAQTTMIAFNPDKYVEKGWAHWLLGDHPTPSSAVMYFALWVFAMFFWLSIPVVPFLHGALFTVVAVIEWFTVYENYKIGLK